MITEKMKSINNETLLAWSDFEVVKARWVLRRAEEHNETLSEKVRLERDETEQKEIIKAYLKKLGVSWTVYDTASSLEELLVMVADKKEFLRRCGVSEDELKP